MGGKGSGPIPKSVASAGVQRSIDVTAPQAITILRNFIERKRGYKTLGSDLQRACEYIIDHAIGKARQKIEHSGGILTYGELAKSAETLDSKPRPVLADVMELANLHTPEPVNEPETQQD